MPHTYFCASGRKWFKLLQYGFMNDYEPCLQLFRCWLDSLRQGILPVPATPLLPEPASLDLEYYTSELAIIPFLQEFSAGIPAAITPGITVAAGVTEPQLPQKVVRKPAGEKRSNLIVKGTLQALLLKPGGAMTMMCCCSAKTQTPEAWQPDSCRARRG